MSNMAGLSSINRKDLLQWADTITARSELPRLLRRLILETARGVVRPGFPAGEGVAAGGWDGSLVASEAAPYIPAGLSVWELSVEKAVETKADKDFDKRNATPDGSPTAHCTYVAVGLRPWTGRQAWATKRTAEGTWKGVRALGVDDVETWLESAPITHAWISQLLGRSPYGFRPVDLWWEAWAAATTPAMTPALVLAGRSAQHQAFIERLAGPGQTITIQAGSLEEVQSFVAASILRAAAEGHDHFQARAAFVDDLLAWRELHARSTPLILIATTEQIRTESLPSSAHHIVLPLIDTANADIELPPLDETEAAEALKASQVEEQRAAKLGQLARRSLLMMRRELANKPELHQPPWAKPPISRTVRSVLLAGRWHDGQQGDKSVLEALSGLSYDDLREALANFTSTADPFVSNIDVLWSLVSAYDAWSLLARHIRPDDLARLRPIVIGVLGETDPALELPQSERWRAGIDGKVLTQSAELRQGLASTLAFLGLPGANIDAGSGINGSDWAAGVVTELLRHANEDLTCKRWSSLSDLLPVLAEAAPDAFLAATARGLEGHTPLLRGIFDPEAEESLFGSRSAHSSLLWALETVAWSDQHFGRAVDLLARLAEIDPGGRLSNRPSASLASIFNPWHPDNSVDVARQLAALDAMRQRHPSVAWPLMLTMLPEGHAIHMPTSEPRFRAWKLAKVVTWPEYFKVVTAVVTRLVEDARRETTRWVELIQHLDRLPPADREAVLIGLSQHIEVGDFSNDDKAALWESLRSLTAKHREYSDAPWALPTDELTKIDNNIQAVLTPTDPLEHHAWLFQSDVPDIPTASLRDDYTAYSLALAELRKAAVADVDAHSGFEALRQLARRAMRAGFVGLAVADATEGKYEDELLPMLGSDDAVDAELSLSYAAGRFTRAGWRWVETMLEQQTLTSTQQGILLLTTADRPRSWQRADELNEAVANEFWKRFSPYGLGPDFAHTVYAAERLIGVGRFAAAVGLIELYLRREQSDVERMLHLAASALEALLTAEDPEMGGLREYSFQQLFDHFFEHKDILGLERVARLEWAYLPALGFKANPRMLSELLARDPSFYVEVVSAVYRPASDEDAPQPSEAKIFRAQNAYRLLDNWSILPGTHNDGQLDTSALAAWLSDAICGLEQADRLNVGQLHIGNALGRMPADADGSWPSQAVRDVLETQQSDKLDEGFYIAVINGRGMVSRSLDAGGDQERSLAEKYRTDAEKYMDQWPRTAAILRALADRYEVEARREDNSAERFRRGIEN